jgi:hypothetical protein
MASLPLIFLPYLDGDWVEGRWVMSSPTGPMWLAHDDTSSPPFTGGQQQSAARLAMTPAPQASATHAFAAAAGRPSHAPRKCGRPVRRRVIDRG